jgi:osmotically-inducible protein OsmY
MQVGILLGYLGVVYLIGYLALRNAARRASRTAKGVR